MSSPSHSLKSLEKLALNPWYHILFGPFRPFFCKHTVAEGGGSVWLRTEAILIYRLFATATLTLTLVLFSATADIRFSTLGAWSYLLSTLAFCIATFASLRYLLVPERSSALDNRGPCAYFADFAVPLMQTALTLEFTVALLYWAVLRKSDGHVAAVELFLYAVGPLLLLADILLAFRMWFRLAYAVLAPAVGSLWLTFAWIRSAIFKNWPYSALEFRREGVAKTIVFHLGIVLGAVLVGLGVILLNRLNRVKFVSAIIRRRVADEEVASMASSDLESLAERELERIVVTSDFGSVRSISAPLPLYVPKKMDNRRSI